ncbi:ATP-dependent DNA helicase 2 subunit KU80-like [Bidens hawaiensis]|uniref:ATP-dependent DNA helicase 2 subunit KU80-like n=1 Tax=Bidens hawaiensis TaxID=980011 RepID=UPI00404AFE5B
MRPWYLTKLVLLPGLNKFPSFNSLPVSLQPSAEQQEAADKLVMMLDLAPAGKEEYLRPEFTPNPVLERFYHHLELKSKHPDAAVPPLDESLKRITEPDPEVVSKNKLVLDDFRRHFELKENPKLKKLTRRLLKDKTPGSYENQSTDLIASTSEVKVETLGDLTSVADFEAMISRRDSPEWVSKAIFAMKNKILDLVENSLEGDNYPKALECLIALRKGCVIEQEPKQFNDFLSQIFRFCQEAKLSSFWEFLASNDVTLITKTEAEDSDIKEQDARSLFVKPEPRS